MKLPREIPYHCIVSPWAAPIPFMQRRLYLHLAYIWNFHHAETAQPLAGNGD